jgi:hypothetical protein
MDPVDIAIAAERIEARAWTDWYAAAPPTVRAVGGQGVIQVADATLLMAPGIAAGLFNRAIGLGMQQPATEGALRAIIDAYRDARVASWVLQWSELARPAELPALARSLGFAAPATSWAKMWRSREPVPRVESTLQVGEVTRLADADAWSAAVANGNGVPALAPWLRALYGRAGWRLFTLRDAEQAVGGGALFIDGDHAWLGMGAVLPTHRQRRGQRSLMACRLEAAIAAGAQWIFTETGEPRDAVEPNPSLANMKLCGFTKSASRLNLAVLPEG